MKVVCVIAMIGISLAAPNKLLPRTGGEWTPESLVNPEELGEYFEGDILLPLPPLTKNGLLDEKYRWPNGVVPYKFSDEFSTSQMDTVRVAMDHYKEVTKGCITFVERTSQHNYILFTQDNSQGCNSIVGMVGGAQTLNLPRWCLNSFGSTVHEMYHALGFYHEQSRSDRDSYVTIMWQNIEPGAEQNFNKYPDTVISGFGEEYDYGSLMHYGAYAFTGNGQKTIVTKDPNASIGQRKDLSAVDIKKLMNMYNC